MVHWPVLVGLRGRAFLIPGSSLVTSVAERIDFYTPGERIPTKITAYWRDKAGEVCAVSVTTIANRYRLPLVGRDLSEIADDYRGRTSARNSALPDAD